MAERYVYVASSWRCERQPVVIDALRRRGVDCYDFRNPPESTGFGWREVCPRCGGRQCGTTAIGIGRCVFPSGHGGVHLTEREAHGYHRRCADCGAEPGDAVAAKGTDHVTAATYLAMVEHPRAIEGYAADFAAMERADTFALVLPCNRSAHLELGWAVGQGKRTAILLEDPMEPELMYRMVEFMTPDLDELVDWAER